MIERDISQFSILGCPIKLYLIQNEEMLPPQKVSTAKQDSPKMSPPKKKNNRQARTGTVCSKISRRQRKVNQANQANQYADSLVNISRYTSEAKKVGNDDGKIMSEEGKESEETRKGVMLENEGNNSDLPGEGNMESFVSP